MTKVTLAAVGSLQDTTTAANTINANTAAIVTAFDNTLSRNGLFPNQMQATLDMNSNHIINLPAPASVNEPLRLTDANTLNGGGTINIINNNIISGLATIKSAPYNAVGNGIADDTAAIQAMIDASAPGHLTGPVSQLFPIMIPPGTYKISQLNATNILGFTMIGQGSGITYPLLTWAGTATNTMIDLTGSAVGAHIENFQVQGPISDGTFASYPVCGILLAASTAGGANFNTIRNISVSGRFQIACLYIYGVSNSYMEMCGFTQAQQISPNCECIVYTASNSTFAVTSSFATISNLANAGGSDWLMNRCEMHSFTGGSTTSGKAVLMEGPITNYQFNNGVQAAANGFIVEVKGSVAHVGYNNVTFYTDQGPVATVALGSVTTGAILSNLLFTNCNTNNPITLYSFGGGATLNGVLLASTIASSQIPIAGIGTNAAINGVHI